MASIAQEYSLFGIDRELDDLLHRIEEEIEALGEASAELIDRFQAFCEAHGEKADRIGRFIRMMEARVQYCRSEATRLLDRARSCDRNVTQTKNMVLYYLMSRELKKIEGREFTLRIQKQPGFCSVHRRIASTHVPEESRGIFRRADLGKVIAVVPCELKHMLSASIREAIPSNEAIKQATQSGVSVPGAEVYRGNHSRVA